MIKKHSKIESGCTSNFRPLMPAPPAPPLAFAVCVVDAAADKFKVNVLNHALGFRVVRYLSQSQGESFVMRALFAEAAMFYSLYCTTLAQHHTVHRRRQCSKGVLTGGSTCVPVTNLGCRAILHYLAALATVAAHTYGSQ